MPSRKEAKNKGRSGSTRHAAARPRGGPGDPTTRRTPGVAPLGIVAAVGSALLYLPALPFGWIWNDSVLVASKGAAGPAENGFAPVAYGLTRLEWIAGVGQPGLFHATSVLLYALAVWLVYRLAISLGAGRWLAFGAALLFGAHPAHVEAVAYVSGRPALLGTALALAALLVARSARVREAGGWRSWPGAAALALAALAVFSSELALVTPFVLLGLDRWGAPRLASADRRPLHVGFFAAAGAAVVARWADGSFRAAAGHEGVPAGAAWSAPLHATYEYLRLLILPTNLNAIRSLGRTEAASAGPIAGAILLVVALAAFTLWRRRDPLARCGAVLLALPLLPALPIPYFQGAYVEERSVIFASAGFVLLAASFVAWLGTAIPGARRYAPAILVAAAVAGAYGTLARIPVWRDNISLLQAAVQAAPSDPEPYYKLARNHFAVGEYDAALTAVDRAIAADSTYADAHHLRTVLLSRRGDYANAEREARRSIALDARDPVAWANLGDALTQQGKLSEALDACRRAVALDSTVADNWYNLGVALGSSGDLAGADAAYRRALARDPRHVQAVNNLGAVLAAEGKIAEARDAYRRAVALAPGSVETRMNLALAYLRLGDRENAAKEREVIRRQDPALGRQLDELFRAAGGGAPAR